MTCPLAFELKTKYPLERTIFTRCAGVSGTDRLLCSFIPPSEFLEINGDFWLSVACILDEQRGIPKDFLLLALLDSGAS